MAKRLGVSYKKRVEEINRIYDREVRRGLPNREIWRRFIYPVYGITERTFYNILNASADENKQIADDGVRQLLLFSDEELENMIRDNEKKWYER
jgi:hypothetical protein